MGILSRYVLREFLTPVAYCFIAFASLHLVFELFGEFDKILQASPSPGLVLRYIGGYLAKDFQWLITPSLLLGGLYAMWQLARHSEITAMRASGIGFATITAPMLGAAVVFSLVTFACSEFYAPAAIRDAINIKENLFKSAEDSELTDVPYNNAAGSRDWQIDRFSTASNVLQNVRVTWTSEEGYPVQVLVAQKASHSEGVWWFENATVTRYRHQPGAAAQVATGGYSRELLVMPELDETPRDFIIEYNQQAVTPVVETLSVRDMVRYVKMRPNLAGAARHTWIYEIVNRFAAPLACVFITLFAVPAGVATGRQSVFAGVATAILLFIGYYALSLFCGVQAKSGHIPIWIGVMAPNLLILGVGIHLFHRQR